ncbi:uncharacterized protein [Mytilus edulis]|uniref:uncharacterized protein n=1 Tax=Mytilus edulis TaxID=6550 RepID=UPI0039EE885E
MKRSKAGRFYQSGKKLQIELRRAIVDQYGEGKNVYTIANETNLDTRTVKKTLEEYMSTGDLDYSGKAHGPKTRIANETVILAIEYYLHLKPSMYLQEIQKRLLYDGISLQNNVPSVSYIHKIIKDRLGYTRKKLTVKAKEGLTDQVQVQFDHFLDSNEDINPLKIHCFDESSVIMTTGNRHYGYSELGQRAFEIQKYASNATFTVNLLQSPLGVDYFNIIDGPSNGLQLVNFFVEALNETDIYGNSKLSPGDVIVLDNCGFHHGQLAETHLRNLLQQYGITLAFLPPYHPELNTCEHSFSKMKYYLRRHETYTTMYPELAICDAINEISRNECFGFAKHCGYIL